MPFLGCWRLWQWLDTGRTNGTKLIVRTLPCNLDHLHVSTALRGDLVRLETYFQEDGRLTSRRDWRLLNAVTGQYLGAATRCVVRVICSLCCSSMLCHVVAASHSVCLVVWAVEVPIRELVMLSRNLIRLYCWHATLAAQNSHAAISFMPWGELLAVPG